MDRPQPWGRRTVLQGLALGGLAGTGIRAGSTAAAPSQAPPSNLPTAPPRSTAVIWGDSITALRDGAGESSTYYSARGYWTWAEILSRQRVRLMRNAGVGRQDTGQVLARFDSDVKPFDPGWVVIECGANDLVVPSPSATTMTDNLAAMLDRVASIEARAVLCTVPPHDSLSAGQRAVGAQVNHWIRAVPFFRPGVAVADFWQALVDPLTGGVAPGLSGDGLHPNGNGAYRCGLLLAQILDQQVPPLDVLGHDLADPLLLSKNPFMAGTSGLTDLQVDGPAASDWSVGSPPLKGVRIELRKVPRTDAVAGEWQQVRAASKTEVRLFQVQDDVGGSWSPGTTQVYAICEFETDRDWSQVSDFHLEVSALDGWLKPQWTVAAPQWASDDPWLPGTRPASGVLQTPVMTVPPSTNKSLVAAVVFNGAGTFRVGRFALYKLA